MNVAYNKEIAAQSESMVPENSLIGPLYTTPLGEKFTKTARYGTIYRFKSDKQLQQLFNLTRMLESARKKDDKGIKVTIVKGGIFNSVWQARLTKIGVMNYSQAQCDIGITFKVKGKRKFTSLTCSICDFTIALGWQDLTANNGTVIKDTPDVKITKVTTFDAKGYEHTASLLKNVVYNHVSKSALE